MKSHFRFYPGAYDDGTFKKLEAICVVCGESDQWFYDGGCYSVISDSPVCACCIAGDKLRSHFGENFALHDIEFSADAGEYEREIMQLTPGIASVNPFTWPVRLGIPMAFLGYGDDTRLWNDLECRAAMIAFWKAERDEDLDGPTPHDMVFQALDKSAFGFDIDWC